MEYPVSRSAARDIPHSGSDLDALLEDLSGSAVSISLALINVTIPTTQSSKDTTCYPIANSGDALIAPLHLYGQVISASPPASFFSTHKDARASLGIAIYYHAWDIASTCFSRGISADGRAGNKGEDGPPRYMFITQAISQLLEVESPHAESVLSLKTRLVVALSRIGCDAGSDNTQQRIVCGTLEQLSEQHSESFGEPFHSLVIVGKRLHHLEAVYMEEYAAFVRVTWYRHRLWRNSQLLTEVKLSCPSPIGHF
ncbi:hypothetical protein PISMIDRAFT_8554 [Pisolithus microcarpus 441]|uniref:Uncharacterized protein n=1 Tax=Pisolithus microcarpus 441 TaxID=765257 RepID=A0A0C9ZCR2_9AGAM|nr:hypothetical protein PISMIDRAFT_8554 [Pisolithus microcarpus 441]